MNQKNLERILILRTMINYSADGMVAKDIADRASTECDHDLLESLPPVSRRAIGQKLQSMMKGGLVAQGRFKSPRVSERVSVWSVTDAGRELAASIDGEEGIKRTRAPEPYYYLAGPMTGYPAFNFPAFDAAASDLRGRGYNITSPAELDDHVERSRAMQSPDGKASIRGSEYLDFLTRDVNIVMDEKCLGIICIDGWESSHGARLETYVATAFNKPVLRYGEEPMQKVSWFEELVIT